MAEEPITILEADAMAAGRPWRVLLGHRTARGRVLIGLGADGRFHVVFGGESLADYATMRQAVAAAASGRCGAARDGTELEMLGISDDPLDWLSPDDLSL